MPLRLPLTRRNRWIVGSFLAIVLLYTGSFAALSRVRTVETHVGGPTFYTFCKTEQGFGRCLILVYSSSPKTEQWLGRIYRPLIIAEAYALDRRHLAGVLPM